MRPPIDGNQGSPGLPRPNDMSSPRLNHLSRTLSTSAPSKRKSLAEFDISALQLENVDADMLALDTSSQSFIPQTRPDSQLPSIENFKNLDSEELQPGQRLSLKQISPHQSNKRATNLFTDSELDDMHGKKKKPETQHNILYYLGVFFRLSGIGDKVIDLFYN
eukprot:snap_masked-scaffold_7-processed-gene-11.17-mRNA-1 protein AED:0.96 eAED:1.00 QI:0/0/0/0.5/1/1/2/0/162